MRGMLVRSENQWLYRDVTRQTKNCSVWSAFEPVLPYGDGQRTWAGIIQVTLPQLVWELQAYTRGVGILKIDFRIKFDQQGISKNYVGFVKGYA